MKANCKNCLKYSSGCTVKEISIVDGKCIDIVTNDISYSQHRLFRGLILPALAEAMGETNNQYVHDFILKPEWIYRQTGKYFIPVNNYNEIPDKHKGKCREIIEYSEGHEGEPKCSLIIGYIPSMSQFTKADTKSFFLFCETLLEEIDGSIPTEQSQEYKQLRERVLK